MELGEQKLTLLLGVTQQISFISHTRTQKISIKSTCKIMFLEECHGISLEAKIHEIHTTNILTPILGTLFTWSFGILD